MPYFVYMLKCADNTYYTGCTNNLEERVIQHNQLKSGAHYTKLRRPVKLVFKEEYPTLLEARQREAEIKRLKKEEKIRLSST